MSAITLPYNNKYPSIQDLRSRTKRRIPKFVFEYLDGGCNEELNLYRNTADIREIDLTPQYLKDWQKVNMRTELFGQVYDAPFGIAPIGLQDLIWPKAGEILAKAAFEGNIPYVLSTMGNMSIERASELTEGKFWFQLYHPVENALRDDMIDRAEKAECQVLVLLSDVPSFGLRAKDIRNGLSVPPKMTVANIIQMLKRPSWAMNTLIKGQPVFKTLEPYMPKDLAMAGYGAFMNQTFDGRLSEDRIAVIRDKWKGKLVLKGVVSEADTEKAIKLGLDGIIVSNHGGRQLDAGTSSIKPTSYLSKKYGKRIRVMMDSGIRSGPDIARSLAVGAEFCFLGRSFMYGVGALGPKGGTHTVNMLKAQLKQVMEQICCEQVADFPEYLEKRNWS